LFPSQNSPLNFLLAVCAWRC